MNELLEATEALAAFVVELERPLIPDDVWNRAKWIVADTIGVAIQGAGEEDVKHLAKRMTREGVSVVFHPGFKRVDCNSAAVINAVSICSQELDEGTRPTGHPALHVLPVALALAQSVHATGTEFLTSFIAGYELQYRIQRSAVLRPNIHPHGNLGNIGAIAAVGKLLRWTKQQLVEGMNAAAAFAMATSWKACTAGATIRNAYPAATAQMVLLVRDFVESGFTGYDGALGETYGELLGESIDFSLLTNGLGSSFGVMDNYFKFHAACALTHPVLDAVIDALGPRMQPGEYPCLVSSVKLDLATIARIDVRVLPRSMRLSQVAHPNPLSFKFSIPFAVATLLKHGDSGPARFRADVVEDEDLVRLQQLVQVIPMHEWVHRWPLEHPALVSIILKDGASLTGASSNPYGSQAGTINQADLAAKFNALTADLLSADEQGGLWNQVMNCEALKDMSNFPGL
ncbi:MmgE/PrpD family protein [Alicyclobacillus mengziensis]|uniref:MmgE/PrpD family protein n=1 Tax=Alicyclobacillus mengziensis TaxID=2931921 RepID=A0A9X7W249_9BACL|nr:MmgE/PrpD family protein [Alicyclobacillus mengziensis]QSO49363.1 MmgE/PrpD family protein [Alicyclobacillus mengziensis]